MLLSYRCEGLFETCLLLHFIEEIIADFLVSSERCPSSIWVNQLVVVGAALIDEPMLFKEQLILPSFDHLFSSHYIR